MRFEAVPLARGRRAFPPKAFVLTRAPKVVEFELKYTQQQFNRISRTSAKNFQQHAMHMPCPNRHGIERRARRAVCLCHMHYDRVRVHTPPSKTPRSLGWFRRNFQCAPAVALRTLCSTISSDSGKVVRDQAHRIGGGERRLPRPAGLRPAVRSRISPRMNVPCGEELHRADTR